MGEVFWSDVCKHTFFLTEKRKTGRILIIEIPTPFVIVAITSTQIPGFITYRADIMIPQSAASSMLTSCLTTMQASLAITFLYTAEMSRFFVSTAAAPIVQRETIWILLMTRWKTWMVDKVSSAVSPAPHGQLLQAYCALLQVGYQWPQG